MTLHKVPANGLRYTSVIFTGTLEHFTRVQAEKMATGAGAWVMKGAPGPGYVQKVLIAGIRPGKVKFDAAEKYGWTIVGEGWFIEQLVLAGDMDAEALKNAQAKKFMDAPMTADVPQLIPRPPLYQIESTTHEWIKTNWQHTLVCKWCDKRYVDDFDGVIPGGKAVLVEDCPKRISNTVTIAVVDKTPAKKKIPWELDF